MELFLHLGVFVELLGRGSDSDLKFFASIFALADEGLVFSDIFLKVIEDLQLLIKSNQGVEFVLKLYFFFLQHQL